MRTTNRSNSADEEEEQCRKARKRATDRRAQRDHRLRQKAYIKRLEESVRELSAQRTNDEVVNTLLAEQARLVAECSKLAAKLERVRVLVSPEDHGADVEIRRRFQSLVMRSWWPRPKMKLCNHLPAQGRKVHEGFSGHEEHLYPQQNGQDYHRLPSPDAPSLPRETATAQDDLPVIDMNDDDMGFLQYCRQENRVSLCDPNPSVPGSSENVPCPNPSSNLDFGSSFSRYCAPSSRSDTVLLAMVDEARKEHEHGRFDTTEPSLHQLLSDPPRDTLSFRLFHHLCGYGAMPLHLLLSIFWTQYLVLRLGADQRYQWHVLRTSAALERVPEFLRPTPTERVIPHQFFIGMLSKPAANFDLIKKVQARDPFGIDKAGQRRQRRKYRRRTSPTPESVLVVKGRSGDVANNGCIEHD
ncbi:hypothetical protein AJ79_02944 [Helicocarpus griseus UAMH5409]|uniref:BZIP domain-containing protein n=1 Tax=Helicocarpus griseus UAMH5409 TaxID=1447875 RepID=A0A2B7Y0C0_9EURO|nr:hypothetical protein AJ79_02944 [Helicocarpus griseus UAMH5409]